MTEWLHFNGVHDGIGGYVTEPVSLRDFHSLVLNSEPEADSSERLLFPGIDPWDLSASGWAMVVPEATPPAIREALAPLLAHRRGQAGERCREIPYRPPMSVRAFLRQQTVGAGPLNPEILPYYVVLIGGPEVISFRFQNELGLTCAVGRLSFDTAEEYARYVETVIAIEQEDRRGADAPRAVFFAPCQDGATETSADQLTRPLTRRLAETCPAWQLESFVGGEARRSRLLDCLGPQGAPAFLFTAGHGMAFDADDPRQKRLQGALLCQDWDGSGPVQRDHYLAGEDVQDDSRVRGLVSFHFACFGAGTPELDRFVHRLPGLAKVLSPQPRIAELGRRLLTHRRGGALAFIGHVDRAWGYSFLDGSQPQVEVFAAALTEMFNGYPVGAAMEFFSQRYGQLAAYLITALHDERSGRPVAARELVSLWTATQDARGYVILGDPAVRLHAGGV